MKGTHRYHAAAKRWYVRIYWDGEDHRIWKYNGEKIDTEERAIKLLNKIRAEIDTDTFNIKAYLPDSPLSVSEFSKQWLLASTASPATKKFYRKAIDKAIAYFGKDFDIRHFTHSKLQIFYNSLPMSVKGKYNVLTTLKTMLHYAYKDELISRVPPFPALPLGLPEEIRYLTYEEQQNVLNAIPERHRGIYEFAMEYGLRIGEVLALQWDCVTEDEIIIRRAVSDGEIRQCTKTGKTRHYGITERVIAILEATRKLPVISPYVFARENGKPYTWKVLTKTWKRACKAAGVEINLYNGIRHSLGGQLMDQGVELSMVRDILGHTNDNMTRRYCKRSNQVMTKVLDFRTKKFSESLVKQKTATYES